jgi:hypothetical protein
MNRVLPCLLLVGALLAFSARAQDPKPAAAAPAAPAAAEPAKPAPGPGQEPDPAILQGIMECLAEGLPKDWKKAWFVVKEIDRNEQRSMRQFEANFFYATNPADNKGRRLKPCGAERVVDGVSALNDYLPENQQRWTSATFNFTSDGKFEVKYDFTPPAPKPAADAEPKPAAKPSAKSSSKKKQEASK